MRTITRQSLAELAKVMPVLSEEEQRSYIGGGDGSQSNPYTYAEYEKRAEGNELTSGCYVKLSDGSTSYCFPSASVKAKKEESESGDNPPTGAYDFSQLFSDFSSSGSMNDSGYRPEDDSGFNSGSDSGMNTGSGSTDSPPPAPNPGSSKLEGLCAGLDVVANGLSLTSDAKRAVFEYVKNNLGDIGRGGEIYIKVMKNIGRGCGFWGIGRSIYEADKNPTAGNIAQMVGEVAMLFIKVNPYGSIAITVLDMTGASDWIYDKIGGYFSGEK